VAPGRINAWIAPARLRQKRPSVRRFSGENRGRRCQTPRRSVARSRRGRPSPYRPSLILPTAFPGHREAVPLFNPTYPLCPVPISELAEQFCNVCLYVCSSTVIISLR
jgi:hypothetical protein